MIILNEEDNRNRKSTEELERSMFEVLKALDIDLEKMKFSPKVNVKFIIE
jgi:hypothetical protein